MILFKSRKDKSFLLVLNIDVCVTGFTQLRTWALMYSQGGMVQYKCCSGGKEKIAAPHVYFL